MPQHPTEQAVERPPIATDFVRAAKHRGLAVDERPEELDGIAIQIRDDAGTALDLFFFRSATSGRWRNGQFRGVRNARAVRITTIREAADFMRTM